MHSTQSSVSLPQSGTILGEFEVLEEIGRGGFAAVYRARQRRMDREVAVKVLMPAAADGLPDLPQRFLREIDVVKRLEHPNIVRLYDFGQTAAGLLWMAMEIVRGQELQDALAAEGAFVPQRVRHIAKQILSGLAEAHEMKIVHRDLKPGNIMLARKGAERDLVKILDFGVGKALREEDSSVKHDLTSSQGGTFGTPRYMAPEQLKNTEMGTHTDVYAAGLIIYEMLLGRPAISGTTTYEVLVKQIAEPLDFPEELRGTDLFHVLNRATAKEWDERYANALQFYEALEEVDFDDPRYLLPETERKLVEQGQTDRHPKPSKPITGRSKTSSSHLRETTGKQAPITAAAIPAVTKQSSPPPLPINTAANPIPDFEADAVLDGAFPSEPLTVVTPRPDYAADALDTPPRRNVPAALVAAAAVGVLVLVGVVLVIAWPRGESSPDSAAAGAEKPAATEWPEVGVKPLIEPDLSAMPELPATPVATPAQLDKLQTRSLLGATRAADGAKRAIKRLIRAGKPKDPKQGNGSNTTTPDIWNIKHN